MNNPAKPASHTASSPQHNAVVTASAGTGKTWLLVTRIIRLLLAGARPDALLAISFTRKAALEMQTRLAQRLFEFAHCEDTLLDAYLQGIGVVPSEQQRQQARNLYELLLRSEQPPRITTFHAFCQDLLRHFPLEAGVPSGFELSETTAQLEREAQARLFSAATEEPAGKLAQALDRLFSACGASTQDALNEFLRQRSDWWAFTEGQRDPAAFAAATLARQLNIDENADYLGAFFCAQTSGYLAEFRALLTRHGTATNLTHAELLAKSLRDGEKTLQHVLWVKAALLTDEGAPRSRKLSKVQAKSMGEDGQQRFLLLHEELCSSLLACLEQQARLNTFNTCTAWYFAGMRLLEYYQQLKSAQRLLDFADLEWKAYQLLNHADNAQWVQYKLDQRIDHLLVDEFQDTNPTQWNLLLPLLNELAAGTGLAPLDTPGAGDRRRTAFLVGDSKQSIYRFRRADPRLLETARAWLSENLGAGLHHLDMSWRSAPAIIEFINTIFADGPLRERLQTFETHDAHHRDLPGRVEILPLIGDSQNPLAQQTDTLNRTLRNPLRQPRVVEEEQRHYEEGKLIAQKITQLLAEHTLIQQAQETRPLHYQDILILLRNRTHAHAYERALRERGIPYLGAERGTLLDSLEVRDMLALIDLLISPYNNLALAQVLRSPLFSCSDADLMLLAQRTPTEQQTSWMERLDALAPQLEPGTPLQRAHHWLTRWQAQAGFIPVHDLMNSIYYEANVLARYEAAFPEHLKTRVRSNLTRFIELALDVDNGRYPSLAHFRARLRDLQRYQQDAPDEVPASDMQSCVRIMTIHAAKGLEAPVVFLADAANSKRAQRPYRALIDWPSGAQRPRHFMLTAKKAEQDSLTRALLEQEEIHELREDANLLYVALTRARQFLFISASAPLRSNDLGWYGMIVPSIRQEISIDS